MAENPRAISNRQSLGRRISHNWEVFDSLPREIKEILWNASTSCSTGDKYVPATFAPEMRARRRKVERQHCLKTYGPDHPQAAEPDDLLEALTLSETLPQVSGPLIKRRKA
jgi:hypothetical protein